MNHGRRASDLAAARAAEILAPVCARKDIPWWPILGLPVALFIRYFF